MNDVKMAFVREVLSRKGEEMRQAIIKAITREGISNPSLGLHGIVKQNSEGTAYEMTVPILRRFQDMGAPLRRIHITSENVLTHNFEMLKGGRKFKIYNRYVWGYFDSIARELMYGLTKEVAQNIKQQLNK